MHKQNFYIGDTIRVKSFNSSRLGIDGLSKKYIGRVGIIETVTDMTDKIYYRTNISTAIENFSFWTEEEIELVEAEKHIANDEEFLGMLRGDENV